MTAPRISAFHRQDNAVLSCIRDRVGNRHKVVVDSPEAIVNMLGQVPVGLVVDVIGHSHDGFLNFGAEDITDAMRFVAIFQALRAAGVAEVRLLGCEIADSPEAAAAITSLRRQPNMPRISASSRGLTWRDYNHAGLRPTSEPAVFDFPPDPSLTDPPLPLTQLFDESPVSVGSGRRVSRPQVLQLEAYLSPDHLCCCPAEFHIDGATPTLKAFEMELERLVGRGRVVALPDGTLFVVAQKGTVEVLYRVAVDHSENVRDIIAGW
jgi:hypothetical protein